MTRTLRSLTGSTARSIVAATLLGLGATAQPALAQWGRIPGVGNSNRDGQLLFAWQGRVDRETQIIVGRDRPGVRGVDGRESRGRFTAFGYSPRGDGVLIVQRVDGRGDVDVIRQLGNGREGVIRIRDSRGGDDTYAIRVYWRPANGNVYGRNDSRSNDRYGDGSYGNDDRYGDDDRYDRRDDRRDDRQDRRDDRRDRRDDRRDERQDRRDDRRWP